MRAHAVLVAVLVLVLVLVSVKTLTEEFFFPTESEFFITNTPGADTAHVG